MYDIRNLIKEVKKTVDLHSLDKTGAYCRWLWQNKNNTRELGINEYGCADAANILYTIGEFSMNPNERSDWIDTLQKLQNEETGMFTEGTRTHNTIHTTAHCIAAIELFDALPKYPLKGLKTYKDKDNLYELLDNLDWDNKTWSESHKGAGVYASLVLADEVDLEWQNWYFEWFWNEADPETGFWRKGRVKPLKWKRNPLPSILPHLAASFHYLFNHEYAKKPLRYPERMIDSCIQIYNEGSWDTLGENISFAEIDWIFCLTRSQRQAGYRYSDCQKALRGFAKKYITYLLSLDYKTHEGFNDLHNLFGVVCALAELQQALPGLIITEKPLKLVLDRRPFI